MSPSEWEGTRWLKTAKIISESEGGDWVRSSISEIGGRGRWSLVVVAQLVKLKG